MLFSSFVTSIGIKALTYPKYKKNPLFDGEMHMLNFIESLLDLKEYFNFWKIYDEEIVWHSSNKSDGNAKECWEDIEICRK